MGALKPPLGGWDEPLLEPEPEPLPALLSLPLFAEPEALPDPLFPEPDPLPDPLPEPLLLPDPLFLELADPLPLAFDGAKSKAPWYSISSL